VCGNHPLVKVGRTHATSLEMQHIADKKVENFVVV
jgi:hypothetical protein